MTLCLAVILSAAKNLAREVIQRTHLSHLEDCEGSTCELLPASYYKLHLKLPARIASAFVQTQRSIKRWPGGNTRPGCDSRHEDACEYEQDEMKRWRYNDPGR